MSEYVSAPLAGLGLITMTVTGSFGSWERFMMVFVAVNFLVNGKDYFVPMAVEEPSVIAAASNAARMVREGGGFTADADPPVMTAQIEIVGVGDPDGARARIEAAGAELIGLADAALPRLSARGGGAREVEVRALPERLVVHVHIDCRDAMGANMVNTVAETLADIRNFARARVDPTYEAVPLLQSVLDPERLAGVARCFTGLWLGWLAALYVPDLPNRSSSSFSPMRSRWRFASRRRSRSRGCFCRLHSASPSEARSTSW